MSLHDLRGRAAMVGTGLAGMGVAENETYFEIAARAAALAVADAGLSLRDVDGIFGCSMGRLLWPVELAEYLGIRPDFCDGTQIGGGSFEAHALSAALALDAGLCNVALICFGATTRSRRGPWPNVRDYDAYLDPYNAQGLHTYAMATQRHMFEFGTTREQLAAAAISARKWAALNPQAFKRDELTFEQVLASPMVSTPITVADCCLITDGAAAVVMTRADRARTLVERPALLLGAGIGFSHMNPSQAESLTTTAAVQSGRRAYEMAGLAPADIDCLQVYDAFTINVLLFLEDLGFCAKGEAGDLVARGEIAPGGRLPLNTNGGGLSCVHPGMYGMFMLVEAFEQLVGRAGARQAPDVETVICHGNGGNLSAQVTTIWGADAAR